MGRWEGASCSWILPSWSEESDTSLVPEHGKKSSSTGQNQVTVCSYMLHLLIKQEWTENLNYFLDLILLVLDYKKLSIRCVLPGGLTKGGEKIPSSLSAGPMGWLYESENRKSKVGNTWALTAAALSATHVEFGLENSTSCPAPWRCYTQIVVLL